MKKTILVCLAAAMALGLILVPVQQAQIQKPDTGYKKFKLEYPGNSGPWGLAALDLDGDGADELAVLWSIYKNNKRYYRLVLYKWGVGGFKVLFQTAETEGDAYGLKVVDLDSDGKKDLIFVHDGLKYYRNEGGKLVSKGKILKIRVQQTFFFGDLDGDGLKDLAVGARLPYTGRARIYKQLKTGAAAGDSAAKPKFKRIKEFPGPADLYMLHGFNLNNDNRTDLISTAYQNGIITLYQNQGNFDFKKVHTHDCPVRVTAVGTLDIENDGYDDIAFLPFTGYFHGLLNSKGTKFEHIISDNYSGNSFHIEKIDINNDGLWDLLLPISSKLHVELMKNETTTEQISFNTKVSKAKGAEGDQFTVGDFDGDRRPDMAFGETFVLGCLDAPRSFRMKLAHVNQVIYTQDKRLIIKGKYFKLVKGVVKIDGKEVASAKITTWKKNSILIQNLDLSSGQHTCLVLAKGEGSTPITFTVN